MEAVVTHLLVFIGGVFAGMFLYGIIDAIVGDEWR